MGVNAAGYLAHLQALLPPGAAWTREKEAQLTKLLRGLAEELARVDQRAADLLRETDPRTCFELLTDWEKLVGLPDPCAPIAATVQERRGAVAAKLVGTGGQNRQYYIDLAAALGVPVTITEFLPFRVGYSAVGDPLATDDAWRHTWQVDAPETVINHFAVGASAVGEPLRSWGNAMLECAIGRRKPAHTEVLFAYYK
ncbi:YmfQ family protein [Pseudomonas sp.]|uniref:YmfQ family protein n=1 Tax=Pseudomonas sp. TaxID=306 RepID=UPI003D0F4DA3